MQLYEQYRPQTLAEFIGQDKIKNQVARLMARPGWDRDALLLCGPSGTGKTSLAYIIAHHVANDFFIEELDGDKCSVAAVRELEQTLCLAAPNSWRVVIVNECHSMSRQAVQAWLTLLERLPKHSLVVFSTTQDIRSNLFGDFAEPFASRCKVMSFTAQGLARLFAARAREIAQAEGLDGAPASSYLRLVQRHHNNFRAVLQSVDSGEML